MSLKFFDKLSQNLIELLNDKEDYNVIIEVENKEKSFTAHSNVLKFRSSYFRRELENIQPNENNIKIINKSSISVQIFNVILQYIYGGIVDLKNCETRFIYDLMLAADEFELEELTNKLETLLIETKGSCISVQIFNVILQYIYGGIVDLKNCETRFIYDLMLAADEFELEELTNKLETLLIETKGSWLRTHFSLFIILFLIETTLKN
ncbi:hypothetical protein Glove_177g137 [Diversispora epigaea]|uniref:BTB domain-containing protein n=1 Tax=Diversispora epigaea TaxID=1348612 RepID=A0A397IXU5_9GLOM|nr:hypothetical protein Glove_177g137 [Diversispora epigaea]